MKNKFYKYVPFLIFFLAISLNSCSREDEQVRKEVSAEVALTKFNLQVERFGYDNVSVSGTNLYAPMAAKNLILSPDGSLSLTEIQAQTILLPMVQPTNDLFLDIGLTQPEIDEMFETPEEKASVGLLLYNVLLQSNTAIPLAKHGDSQIMTCFLEATGFTAGLGIVAGLSAAVITKTALLTAVKAMAKIVGKRALGAIGLALIVAEFTWCMNQ
jgi:hypothetical protein